LNSSNSKIITSENLRTIFYENKAFGEKIFGFFMKNKNHNENLSGDQTLSFADFIYNSKFL